MQRRPAGDEPVQGSAPVRNSLSSREQRLSDGDRFASRWEPHRLVARSTYTDPYEAWLKEHRTERYAATRSTESTGRFRRNQPPKAPWEAIPVTLSPDDR